MNPQQSAELTVITNGATEELDIQLASRAETLYSLPANRVGYDNQQGFGVTSPPAFNTQTSGVRNNESLAQILNGIRQELQQIRQQLRQLETGSNIRDNDRVGSVQSNRSRDNSTDPNQNFDQTDR